jgi:hypothetical protein
MRGLDPRIHQKKSRFEGWIAGSSPAMTGLVFIKSENRSNTHRLPAYSAASDTASGGSDLSLSDGVPRPNCDIQFDRRSR